ncbi:MAG: PAS domain-containing sensor histidine kinase [Fidelibacterota bacterium]
MRRLIPSFRTQIVLIVLFLVIVSALFFRHFFLNSFFEYSAHVNGLDLSGEVGQMYRDYSTGMADETRAAFREDVESVLSMEWQRKLQTDRFEKEMALYSQFIIIFLVLAVVVLFFVTFNLISRPLRRLQVATEALSRGDGKVRVKENRFSPLNNLISSFNRMAGELESNREKILEAEKEVIWREMARVMAHEVKNPLTPIRLALERMTVKRGSGEGEFEQAFDRGVAVIQEEVENLQSLVTEFSEFARLPEATLALHDVNGQLREIVVPYRDRAHFEMVLSDKVPAFQADRVQMKQVFVNIIQNAIESSPEACTIHIATSVHDGEIWVKISDNGPGIDTGDLEKIFEPYFSTRRKGTGLGLAIVKRIVEQHGGTVRVESKPGEGTAFTLVFKA